MKRDLMESIVMDRFSDELFAYINDYFLSKNGIIYKPTINYSIPNDAYIAEHTEEIVDELRWRKPVYEYSNELKMVAKQFMPIFLDRHPEFKDEQCLIIMR